jgi:hypothetical protein
MEGTRDTEIAMGAYQPNHTWTTKKSKPRGQARFIKALNYFYLDKQFI